MIASSSFLSKRDIERGPTCHKLRIPIASLVKLFAKGREF
jgi:hypothetical protein